MKRIRDGACIICAVVALAGCQQQRPAVGSNSAAPDRPALAGDADAFAGPANPIENYKQARMAAAMRGLRYDGGLVQIDATAAASIVDHRSHDEARAAAARGRALLEQGDFVDAVAAHTRAVLLGPDLPEMYDDLGLALTFKGRIEEAAAAYRTALGLDPGRVESRARLANTQQMLNDFPGAIESWRQVLDARPEDVEAHARIAILLYYVGDYAAAWRHVHAAERAGGSVPPQFRPLLAERLSEPQP